MMRSGETKHVDVFLSHSSANTIPARRIARSLERARLSVWFDRTNIRLGNLLRKELQQGITDSRVLVLLWSKAARHSSWVKAELLTAFHLNRFILPCLLDGTSLPQFLQSSVQLDLRRKGVTPLQELAREIRRAPQHTNELLPPMRRESAELLQAINEIYAIQEKELDSMGAEDMRATAQAHNEVANRLAQARKAWPFDHCLLNMAGYHAKNEYLIKHWGAIQAGQRPGDRLLDEAQRFFFDTLFVDPNDCSPLNGLGSVLILQHELDAAEFFVSRSIKLAKRKGIDYGAAKEDLALIRRYKRTG
jgi:hypothetical protein